MQDSIPNKYIEFFHSIQSVILTNEIKKVDFFFLNGYKSTTNKFVIDHIQTFYFKFVIILLQKFVKTFEKILK